LNRFNPRRHFWKESHGRVLDSIVSLRMIGQELVRTHLNAFYNLVPVIFLSTNNLHVQHLLNLRNSFFGPMRSRQSLTANQVLKISKERSFVILQTSTL
jgi:hypothetical protein